MNPTNFTLKLAATTIALSLVGAVPGAQVSYSAKAPPRGPYDIANLTGAEAPSENVAEGDHDATYIADDRPTLGQTFTTGTNAAGYQLRAVSVREVEHETYALVPYLMYALRITKPADGALEVIASETAEAAANARGSISSIGEGAELSNGSGRFITFTFAKPVVLKPNTTYGFDVNGGKARHYWQADGTAANAYPGGVAYSVTGEGKFVTRRGDHVFVVALTAADGSSSGQPGGSTANKPSGLPANVSEKLRASE